MKYLKGFTLAEVLITLGVIGVVAAITIPPMVSEYKKQEAVSKLKRVYTNLNQAVMMSESEYGSVYEWGGKERQDLNTIKNVDNSVEWFNKYIGKHLQILEIKKDYNKKEFSVFLNDGSIITFKYYINDLVYYLNKNAVSNSKGGINTFRFRFNPVLSEEQKRLIQYYKFEGKPTFEPFEHRWDGKRESLINGGSYGKDHACKNYTSANSNKYEIGGGFCTKLIQYDGWKISKDYPVKF